MLLKIYDLSYDHISLYQANKIISKSKEMKLNLLVKRNNNQINTGSIGSGSSNSIEDEEVEDEVVTRMFLIELFLKNKNFIFVFVF